MTAGVSRDRKVGEVLPRQVTPRLKGEPKPKKRKAVAKVRKTPTATLKRKATTLHSQYVRARDGRCVRCGSVQTLQCMHVVSRRFAATRADEQNGHTGCATCHRFLTENPHEHVWFFTAYLGNSKYDGLIAKAYNGAGQTMKSSFWQERIDSLSALLAGVENRNG